MEEIMTRRLFGTALAAFVPCAVSQPAGDRDFHVSPDAAQDGDGSLRRPWTLSKAFAAVGVVKPGSTIWLHGGVYRGGFECRLAGAEGQPITVRPYARQAVTIDAKGTGDAPGISVSGSWTVFRDLEITDSAPDRTATRPAGMSVRGPHTSIVNSVIHDCGIGVGFWTDCVAPAEIYGCVIYNNGWQGPVPDRGHGHAIYAQNREGVKRLADNIMFNQFGYGIHVYGSSASSLSGFDIEGNVSFNNGCLSRDRAMSGNILVGGGVLSQNIRLERNYTYFDKPGYSIRLGFDAANKDVVVRDNYTVGTVEARLWEKMEFTGNTVLANGSFVRLTESAASPAAGRWDGNSYVAMGKDGGVFEVSGAKLSFAQWREHGNRDAASQLGSGRPKASRVFVRPNRYEPGRAHIVVYNWDRAASVAVDLSAVLHPGQRFEILHAQNYFSKPVLRGIFDGKSVPLPMAPRPAVAPVGIVPEPPIPTAPEFDAFVVRLVS